MLAAGLLLVMATLSGTLLTFLYDRSAPFPARMCMGAATGLALLATTGFLFTVWLGLGPASLALSLAVMGLPFLLLAGQQRRELILGSIGSAWRTAVSAGRKPDRKTITYVVYYGVIAIILSAVFSRAVYQTPDGIFTGVRNNLGDLTLHLQIISSFAQGNNFPPEDPTHAGVRFAYPFLADFLTALLARAGGEVIGAMWLQNMVLALAMAGLMHYWTLLLTRDRLAALIASALVLLSGGLGWAWIFQDLHNSPSGLIPLLQHLPHEYTIMDTGGILRWGNSLTTLFVPQRSILFGMPLAIAIFCLWWKAFPDVPQDGNQDSASQRPMLAAGLFAGLLPLIHAHTFLVVMGVAACLALLSIPSSGWKKWSVFFSSAVIALPQLIWLGRSGGVKLSKYVAWQPGWDHGHLNPVLFWLVNTGLFIPLLLLALTWRRPEYATPTRLLRFYLPFLLCFIVPNLVKVSPWIWDNIKVLFWWYVASTPVVALLLARGLRSRPKIRWLAAGALASLVLAGALDLLLVVTGTNEYREFDPSAIAVAKLISDRASPRAVVLHAPSFTSPVLLTGRRSLLGYPGWVWSRGLDVAQRQAEIARMYQGAPDAQELLRRYKVEYVLIGPDEFLTMRPNLEFWSRYSLLQQIGGYRLYRTNVRTEGT
jgi:hypothetical protein